MIKKSILLLIIILVAVVMIRFMTDHSVNIIAVYQNPYTAAVIVENLPWRDRDKITWWRNNEKRLIQRYSLKTD
ncbi:DUF943 family protein, partial [Cronobacter sakazakii]